MLPTSDDFEPRRDGWYEHKAAWGEVTVGTVIADPRYRTKRWEITEVAHGAQVPPGKTLWMRAREQTSGAEFTVEPRSKTSKVVVLTNDPADTKTAPPTPPTDTEAIMLVVEKLGATLMATRDKVTGEVTCPDYTYDSHLDGDGQERPIMRGLIEHMKVAHGMADVDPGLELADAITLHAHAHDVAYPDLGKGGFPHRHVPEDMEFLTGIK